MQAEIGKDVSRVVRAPSLGHAWLEATRIILAEGHEARYEGSAIVEIALMDLVIDNPHVPDELIQRLGDPERISWMHANFTEHVRVAELGDAASYATRLYDYEGSGKDQLAWVIEELRCNPGSRSGVITTLQPLSDTAYIPCVTLLQFWVPDERLELIVTAHSIDFATKGYANLLELADIQTRVGRELGISAGRLILRVTSAHLYEHDLKFVRALLETAPAS